MNKLVSAKKQLEGIYINYLDNPVLNSYYHAIEVETYYRSISYCDNRDKFGLHLYEVFNNFISHVQTKEARQLIDNIIFKTGNNRNSSKKIKSQYDLKKYNQKGYELLELDEPLTFEKLKSCYRKAALKYHPDHGGNHETMIQANEAFEFFHNLIKENAGFSYSIYRDSDDNYSYWYDDEIRCVNDFLAHIYRFMFFYANNNWNVTDAKYWADKTIELKKIKRKKDFDGIYTLYEMAITLTYMGKNEEADYYKNIAFKHDNNEFSEPEYFLNKMKSIQSKVNKNITKTGIIVQNITQAENLLWLGLITKKRYTDSIYRLKERDRIEIKKYERIEKYINEHKFIKLAYDTSENIYVEHKIKSKYIPYTPYSVFDLKILSEDQKAEYFQAFGIKPDLHLVRKYMATRSYSYLSTIILYYKIIDLESTIIDSIKELMLILEVQERTSKFGFHINYILKALNFFLTQEPAQRINHLFYLKMLHEDDSNNPFKICLTEEYYKKMMLPTNELKLKVNSKNNEMQILC